MPFACTVSAVPTVLVDDDRVTVTRWDFEPGATTGWHRHGMDYVVVILTDAVMAWEVDGAVTEKIVKAGDSYSRLEGVEHDVMNAGATPLAFVEIETKRRAG